MGLQVYGDVGPQNLSDGVSAPFRLGKTGETIVQELHGRYYEAVKRGNVYVASTGAAGIAPGTALSTTPPLTIYNPGGSGVDLVIMQAFLAYISGTLGAGALVWGVNNNNTQAAPTSGTPLVPINALLSSNLGRGKAFQGATLAAAPTIFRPMCSLGASLATTPVQPWQVYEPTDGAIVIPQGCSASLQGIAAAGTSPLVLLSAAWEEIPA